MAKEDYDGHTAALLVGGKNASPFHVRMFNQYYLKYVKFSSWMRNWTCWHLMILKGFIWKRQMKTYLISNNLVKKMIQENVNASVLWQYQRHKEQQEWNVSYSCPLYWSGNSKCGLYIRLYNFCLTETSAAMCLAAKYRYY